MTLFNVAGQIFRLARPDGIEEVGEVVASAVEFLCQLAFEIKRSAGQLANPTSVFVDGGRVRLFVAC